MDELQSFCPSKSSSDQDKRLVGYLLILLDKLLDFKVVVIGITRDPESINAVLRRPGRYIFSLFYDYLKYRASILIQVHVSLSDLWRWVHVD